MAGRVMGRPGAMAPEVRIRVRGTVSDAQRETAMAKLRAACDAAPRPVLAASLELALEQNPSLERPARAKASIDVSGRPVRAHVARPTMDEAIDLLMDRLRRNLLRLAECRQDAVHEPAVPGLGEWRHGGLPASRPHYFPRPKDERQIVRRTSPAVPSISPEEAAFEMNMLGHDFHLFTDAGTGADCVLARRADGELELLSPEAGAGRGPAGEPSELEVRPTPTMPLADAVETLDQADAPFVAFVDATRGRLHVVYRRYDGHYGLVVPGDED